MAKQGLFQGSQHRETLLAQGGEIATDAAERHRAARRAETAGDLLLDLHHTDSALGQAIVERHGEVVQESQHRFLMCPEAIEQIAGRRLFASASLADLWWRIGWVGPIAFGKPRLITGFPVGSLHRMQARATLGARLFDGGFAIQEHLFHLLRPGLLLHFREEGQFSQMMHVTEGMQAAKLPVGTPPIMHTHPCKVCQDTDGVQGRFASFGMHSIVREPLGRTHMHPLALTRDVEARFILMQHGRMTQGGFDLLLHWFQGRGTPLYQRLQRAPWMISLSSRLLAAFLAQALGLPMKAIRGGRQVAVVAIFGRLRFQYADAFTQQRDLGSQGRILFSELVQFFVFGHTGTLLACSSLCKPLVLLASYVISLISWCVCSINLGDGSARLA